MKRHPHLEIGSQRSVACSQSKSIVIAYRNYHKVVGEIHQMMVSMTQQIVQLMINRNQVQNRDNRKGPQHQERANDALRIQEREQTATSNKHSKE